MGARIAYRIIGGHTADASVYHGGDGRFKPGNPGKPKGAGYKPIELALRSQLGEIDPATGETNAVIIVRGVIQQAKNGVEWAVKWCADRTEGKARESVTMEVTRPEPIKLFDVGAEAEAEAE